MENVPKSKAQRPATEVRQARELGAAGREDEQLVRRAQAGDVGAFEQLMIRHQRRVFAIVGGILRGREDVEDVAQQVFIKVYLSLGRFDLRSAFSTWLYKVTVNECWDYLRKKKARPLVYEADMSEEQSQAAFGAESGHPVGAEGSPAADAQRRAEVRDLLDRLLAELTEEEQTMLMLKEVEGFSVEEIGEILGLNVNTVKVRLFRARGRLVRLYNRRLAERPKGPKQ
jgi:RNA polymerase sigma-70 factor (ECF subfamily)